jgi:guanine deaminase
MSKLLTNASQGIRGTIRSMSGASHLVSYEDGLLVWDMHGKIIACGEYRDIHTQLSSHVKIQEYRNCLIAPGFVDCHVHLPQLDCRNKTGHTLINWLQYYIYPAEAAFADAAVARSVARRFYQELLKAGTTTAMIYSTVHEEATRIAFEEAEVAGVRAIIGKVMMDQNCPDVLKETTSDSLKATERLISDWHGRAGRLYYAVTPRFALTCSRELIAGAGEVASESGAYFQTHLAETMDEVSAAHELHKTDDYVKFYGDCRCLGTQSMFAHCIYLTDQEWKQLAASGAAVAHCPSSNVFLKSGRMSYEEVSHHNVRCGLGSDVGAGPEFSLWDVMRCGCEVHPPDVFSAKEAFYRATLGSAEALGLADQIGSFDIGKDADIAISQGASDTMQNSKLPLTVATYIKGQRVY